jgi:carboxymethylenebutenolidase
MITPRTSLGHLILLASLAAPLLAGCTDETTGADAASAVPDAGVDAASLGAEAAPAVVPVDAAPDSAADVPAEPDAGVDAAADLSADVAPDAARPGILTVPADDPDVTTSELTFQGQGEVHAYLAVPNRVGSFAGLILIPDERGLTEHLRDVARRFAKTGCVALVPDLRTLTAEALLADLNATLEALSRQPQVGANRHGAAGFGDGGTRALRFAAANPGIRAVVAYYAPPPAPLDTIAAAVLGQYGATDDAVNATIPDLQRALLQAGKPFDKHLYPSAGHGFNDDTAPGYNEDAAVAAWPFTIGWMELYLN